jgi:hypothetical protein
VSNDKPISKENEAHRQRQALCAPHGPQWRKQVRAVKRLAAASMPRYVPRPSTSDVKQRAVVANIDTAETR